MEARWMDRKSLPLPCYCHEDLLPAELAHRSADHLTVVAVPPARVVADAAAHPHVVADLPVHGADGPPAQDVAAQSVDVVAVAPGRVAAVAEDGSGHHHASVAVAPPDVDVIPRLQAVAIVINTSEPTDHVNYGTKIHDLWYIAAGAY